MATGETFSHLEITFSAFVGTEGIDRRVILRELEFDDTHSASQVDNILKGMERAGWDILNVHIATGSDSVYPAIKDAGTLSAVFDALFESPEDAGKIIAYGVLFGWTESHFEHSRYGRKFDDGYQGVYDNEEDFAREFVENDGSEIPWYVTIDWEDTTATIMNDHASYDYGYETYIFVNH